MTCLCFFYKRHDLFVLLESFFSYKGGIYCHNDFLGLRQTK